MEPNNSSPIPVDFQPEVLPALTSTSVVTSCSNSLTQVTSEVSTPFLNTHPIPPSTGITLTQVVSAPPPQLTDLPLTIPQAQDGAYGGFMVVLPPRTTSHPHSGEMTEYQRAQLQKHQQHLILYGLTHAHPGCPNMTNVDITDDIGPPKVDFNAPPAYESVAKPPTYEDVQREKHFEQHFLNGGTPGSTIPPHGTGAPGRNQRPMAFLATIEGENGRDAESDALLGTDFMFITAFIVAFLFNWIGFLLIICFCHTVAARYGALSGFGVSLAKWTFIVRTSTEVTSHENDWLWWLIMAFGCLICIRAFLQYITIKKSWNTLSEQAQERFFFIY
uniref:NEDD4 family-interacting protein 1 n=1 Tax=Cacopsylla melanoneura TaxID=428564 RepID=A0A8D9A0F5_9HEMI